MSRNGTPPFGRRPARAARRPSLNPFPAAGPAPDRGRKRILAGAFTAAAHLAACAAVLFWPHTGTAPQAQPEVLPIQVSFVAQPKPPGPPDKTADAAPAPDIVAPSVPQVTPPVLTIATPPRPADTSDLLSESQLAGAARAGEGGGGGGGGCDIARDVQQALRRDSLVRTAVQGADRLGKASMLWNGDWVRSGGQEGKGLAAVRQAVIWEVGFAPAACRNEPMHGLVVLSLADGRTRFAIGAGVWRWSDLLGLRGVAVNR